MGWIRHHGRGRPIPAGTLVKVRMFNGEVTTIRAGEVCHAPDGTPIPMSRSAGWSAWDYHDGGPMAPKFKEYCVVQATPKRTAVFRSWLDTAEAVAKLKTDQRAAQMMGEVSS